MTAPSTTNRAPCASPRCTHFISVPARVFALISVVCGDELVAEMMSYISVANTAIVTAPVPLPSGSATPPYQPGDKPGEQRPGDNPHGDLTNRHPRPAAPAHVSRPASR